MESFLIVIVLIVLVIIIASSFIGKKQTAKRKYSSSSHYDRDTDQDFYSGLKYELYVMPEVFTSLKALKLRDRIFANQSEVNKLKLDTREAHSLPILSKHESHSSQNTWSDAGDMFTKKKLDEYYKFLEDVRTIFENKSLSADDRFQKIISLCKRNDKFKEYFKNLNEHYKAFPACLFYKELTKVDSIGDSTAYTLFNSGIKTLDELKNASDEDLNEVPGIGKKTIQQIRNYFKNQIDLDDDTSNNNSSAGNETEILDTSIKKEDRDKWDDRDSKKGIVPDVHSMGVRRSLAQILETTAIMSSSKNIETILGRADILRDRITEITRASKTPQYSTDLQYALDEYRSTYYNTDIKSWQMKILSKPGKFNLEKFSAVCLYEGFKRYYSHQLEEISNLKRESAIKNRYKKLHETLNSFKKEFDKEWDSEAANDYKIEKLPQLKKLELTIINKSGKETF